MGAEYGNNRDDPLFTLERVERAADILDEVCEIAGASDQYWVSFYDGPHKFDRAMQTEAFAFFEETLGGGQSNQK